MSINWEVVSWTCITIGVLLILMLGIYYFMSAKALKARRSQILEINNDLKPGVQVLVAGIVGKIVHVKEEFCEVEIAKNTVITVSRYAIQSIIK